MNGRWIFMIAVIAFYTSCNKLDIEPGTPLCIRKQIKVYDRDTHCSSAHVDAYWFQNKTVYVFEPGSCGADMSSPVMDSDCNQLGSLGGFSGNLYINGVDFHKNAVFVKTVWKK